MDDNDHGTHVAGTIGAVGNNGIGVVGVNWNVRLMPCKMFNADGIGTIAAAIACLDYVAMMKDRGVNIVATNNSWSVQEFSQALRDAIDAHRQRGILFVAAAGNYAYCTRHAARTPTTTASRAGPPTTTCPMSSRWRTRTTTGYLNVDLRATDGGRCTSPPRHQHPEHDARERLRRVHGHVDGRAARDGRGGAAQGPGPARDWKAIKNLILAGAEGDLFPDTTRSSRTSA